VRRADQIAGLVLLAFAVAFTAGAFHYPYWTPTGPGSGFLPLWLGGTMSLLALGLFVSATRANATSSPGARAADAGASPLPTARGAIRVLVVVVATALFIALMSVVGMALGTVLFLVVLLHFLEGHGWVTTLSVAVGTALVNWLVFSYWLRVPFPGGVLGF
jgi:putative tricarboxylic transport membrane protein